MSVIEAILRKIASLATTISSHYEPSGGMKTGYIIQDIRRIELKNLIAKREGGSFIIGDVANQHVSPSVGDASLVIEGREFAGNVVRYDESQIIFQPERFTEVVQKLS